MSVINTNISSIQAQNSLRLTQLNQSQAMERLSSGVRINSAKDDAAGLAISTRMTANIRGIAAAVRNANDGISLTQTAEGSLGQISDNLQRIRELAVQSANTGNNASDRAALNNEASQLVAEINRVANNTAFNGIKLLDGTFQGQALQVGAGNDSNDRITISIGSAKATALGVGSASNYSTTKTELTATTSTALAAGGLVLNNYNVGASGSDGVSYAEATSSAIAKAQAVNAVSGSTGVSATVDATSKAFTVSTTSGADTVGASINGVLIGTAGAVSLSTDTTVAAAEMAAAINAVSDQTGVTAAASGAVYTLTAADGRNITVGEGTDAGASSLVSATTHSSINLISSGSGGITIAGTQSADIGGSVGNTAATAAAGAGVSSIDLTTASGSQAALTTLDMAINTITDSRASMGAYQNRLSASISNLETTSQNLQASRSRIMDTDYAKESTNLAKSQIISQAATAMLAQANQSQQSVLALLK